MYIKLIKNKLKIPTPYIALRSQKPFQAYWHLRLKLLRNFSKNMSKKIIILAFLSRHDKSLLFKS